MEDCGGFYCGSCGRTDVWMPPCTCTVEVEAAHVPAKCLRLRGGASNSQEAGPSNIHDSDDDFDYSDMCSNASQAGEDEMLPVNHSPPDREGPPFFLTPHLTHSIRYMFLNSHVHSRRGCPGRTAHTSLWHIELPPTE